MPKSDVGRSLQFAELPGEPERELRSSGGLFGADEAPLEWKGVSRLDWTWREFSAGVTTYYLDGFHEILNKGPTFPNFITEHYVSQTWMFDGRASYTFQKPSAVQPVAGYVKDTSSSGKERQPERSAQMANCAWERLLNDTTITLGCNNVFGQDPPKSAAGTNYPGFLYDPTGRFVYFSLTKKF